MSLLSVLLMQRLGGVNVKATVQCIADTIALNSWIDSKCDL